MRKPKENDQYIKAVEYSHTLEKLLIMERENSAALRSELEAAERERDELRAEQAEHDEQIARMESKFSLAKRALDSKTARCEKAEAELRRRDAADRELLSDELSRLREWVKCVEAERDKAISWHSSLLEKHDKLQAEIARRDAAAGEAVAVLYRNGDVLTKAECGEYFEICCKVEIPLYTAAPPAVLPDIDGYTHGLFPHAVEQLTRFRDDALALGAQQQKVVELPAASVPHGWKLVPLKAFPSQWAAGQKAFDAAGINKIDSVYHAMVEAAPAPGGDGG